MLDQIGHLSNKLAGQAIAHLINCGLNTVTLGHLSKENNFPELALRTVLEELATKNYSTDSVDLSVASREHPGEVFEITPSLVVAKN